MNLLHLAALTLLLNALCRAAPPPDLCAAAKSQAERNQCWDDLYHKVDTELTALYRNLTAAIRAKQSKAPPIWKAHEETALAKLKAAQLAWGRYRDLHCDAAEYQFDGGMISPSIHSNCLRTLTEQRTEELRRTYAIYLVK